MKLRTVFCFALALILWGGLAALLSGCEKEQLPGYWEVDVDSTIAQYNKTPPGYEMLTLSEFKKSRREMLTGRAYIFTRRVPEKPEWGETNFQGSVETWREGKRGSYGAWRMSTNQPGAYEVFAYAVNSGASYWPVGNIRLGTNSANALWLMDKDDQPLVLRRK